MSFLAEILDAKRREVEERKASRPTEVLRGLALEALPPRSLKAALSAGPGGRQEGLRIIAEVKKASPSKGPIRPDFDPVAIARSYAGAGAAAISVLTDSRFFQGSLEDLMAVRGAVSLPILRKDFILDPYQVWEARAAGADAVLLILAAVPNDESLSRLAGEARFLGMDVLWEVHDEVDLQRLLLSSLVSSLELVGINNRNLRTFEVTLETTRRLLPEIPRGVVTVSESGLSKREELEMLRGWGCQAFLVGESLMRSPDPGQALASLLDSRGEGHP